MPKAYSEDLLWRAVALRRVQTAPHSANRVLDGAPRCRTVSFTATASRRLRRCCACTSTQSPRSCGVFRAGLPLVVSTRSARRALLRVDDLAALRELVIADDTLYLDELRLKLAAARGKSVSSRTLLRGLCQLRLSRKRVRARTVRSLLRRCVAEWAH